MDLDPQEDDKEVIGTGGGGFVSEYSVSSDVRGPVGGGGGHLAMVPWFT